MKKLIILFFSIFLFAHNAPYTLNKFKDVLNNCKLQAPTSHFNPIYSRKYGDFENYQNRYFYLQDNKYMVFEMCGYKNRSELRDKNEWEVNTTIPKILKAKVYLIPLDVKKEFTILQIHTNPKTSKISINKPLLRIVWFRNYRHIKNHLWAKIKINKNLNKYIAVDLGDAKGWKDIIIKVLKNKLYIQVGNKKFEYDISYWINTKNYFKAGVYLQSTGCAKVLFDKLEIKE